jgi:hypothetical protein
MAKGTTAKPRVGDQVEIVGHRVGDALRSGEVLEVLGAGPHLHYRVRWQDDHVSLLYPGTDVHFTRKGAESDPHKPRRTTRPS